ncbi:MAG: amidohydrolase, partial [Pyrinomonadaceae bacterium]
MKITTTVLFVLALAFGVAFFGVHETSASRILPADTVFKNGNFYTVNPRRPRAQAVAVTGDRIVFV